MSIKKDKNQLPTALQQFKKWVNIDQQGRGKNCKKNHTQKQKVLDFLSNLSFTTKNLKCTMWAKYGCMDLWPFAKIPPKTITPAHSPSVLKFFNLFFLSLQVVKSNFGMGVLL